MKRLTTYACLVILCCTPTLYANVDPNNYNTDIFTYVPPPPRISCGPCESEILDFYIGAGYRVDHVQTGDSEETIFTSDTFERKYTCVEMVPFFAKAQYRHPCNFFANVYVAYAKAYDGSFKQTGSFTLSEDSVRIHDVIDGIVNKQEAFDASGALGWEFHFFCDFFNFCPMVGYANYQQNLYADRLKLTSGTFDFDPCHANQNYKGYWRGPFVGFSSGSGPYWCNWFLNWGWDYTFAFYTERTRTVFEEEDNITTFIERAFTLNARSHARGNHAWLGIEYRCEPRYSIGIFSDWRWFKTETGPTRYKYAFNTSPYEICGSGTFDGAEWNSWNIYIMVGYHWF